MHENLFLNLNSLLITQITVTSKEDVPEFGPSLPNPAVFSKVCATLMYEHAATTVQSIQ